MAWRVDLTDRAIRDLQRIYQGIDADHTPQARIWFDGLSEAILSLDAHPARGATTPEHAGLRHLLYGRKRRRCRIIYAIDEAARVVTVVHVRHGARDAFGSDEV